MEDTDFARLLTLQPRLLEATVSVSPALDATTARRWRDTQTWTAPPAMFFALYFGGSDRR